MLSKKFSCIYGGIPPTPSLEELTCTPWALNFYYNFQSKFTRHIFLHFSLLFQISPLQIPWLKIPTRADTGLPVKGGANPPGGHPHTILPNLPKDCMKLRISGRRGHSPPPHHHHPPTPRACVSLSFTCTQTRSITHFGSALLAHFTWTKDPA